MLSQAFGILPPRKDLLVKDVWEELLDPTAGMDFSRNDQP
jgi:hypothetical protein